MLLFVTPWANSIFLANLEVKSLAPNGVTFTVKGKSAHDGPIGGSVSLPCLRFQFENIHPPFWQGVNKLFDTARGQIRRCAKW
jgi:hypothetical protein